MRRLLLFLVLVSFYLGIFTQYALFFTAAIPLILLLILSIAGTPQSIALTIHRELSSQRISNGQSATVTLHIRNNGSFLPYLCIEDQIPKGLSATAGFKKSLSLKKGAEHSFSYNVSGARGIYEFADLIVSIYDLAFTKETKKIFSQRETLVILSEKSSLKDIHPQPRKTLVYAGLNPARLGGDGSHFYDIREYQRGDKLRHINWRLSAKNPDQLYTNEFEQERVADIGLILDIREAAYAQNTELLEHSIAAIVALSDNFLRQNNRVGLLIYGKTLDFVRPGYGKLQAEKIRLALSQASIGSHLVFQKLENIPTQVFPAKSQLFYVSPLLAEDLDFLKRLRARSYTILVISPNRFSVLENKNLKAIDKDVRKFEIIERKLMLRNLRRAGIFVLDWDVRQNFEDLIQKEQGHMQIWSQRSRG